MNSKTSRKYRNKKVSIDGIVFDSKKEANRYRELTLLQKSGIIYDLKTQVPFELVPVQREPDQIGKRGGIKKGKVIEQSVIYKADFVYSCDNGNIIVEDVKGVRTKEYIIKRKLMLYVHKIKIKEV